MADPWDIDGDCLVPVGLPTTGLRQVVRQVLEILTLHPCYQWLNYHRHHAFRGNQRHHQNNGNRIKGFAI